MKTVSQIVKLSTEYLLQKKIESPRRQADDIVAAVLGCSRLELYFNFEQPLTEKELLCCRDYLRRRGEGEPLQYIVGSVEFLDCSLSVDRNVLIPRPETELLVGKIIDTLKTEDSKDKILWDICCGSGCIAIALKKRFPLLQVYASDLCSKALAVARENAAINNVEVNFLEGDLLEPYSGLCADFVVSNPPYVSPEEYNILDRSVKDYEPAIALVADNDGLDFYQYYAMNLKSFLRKQGRVWLELGATQGDAVKKLFHESGWSDAIYEQDYAKKDRFFSAKLNF